MDNNEKQQFQMNRRNFLRVGAAATAMGVIGVFKAPSRVASAAAEGMQYVPGAKGQWSKLHPERDFAGATVRYVENNDQWLGTTKLVGTVKNTSEADMGFNLAARGLINEKTQRGVMTFVGKHPFGGAISWAGSLISAPDAVDGKPATKKCRFLIRSKCHNILKMLPIFYALMR
jgi:hypothetical protein